MTDKIIRLILIFFLLAEGILLTFGLPPFQKFDEVSHFTRTVALSRGQLFCQNRQFIIPQVYDNLTKDYSFTQVLLDNQKFPLSNINLNRKWSPADVKPLVGIGGCWQNFLGYIPNTVGIWLTGWTHRPDLIFYTGRIFAFIFFLLMLRLSLKIINPKFNYLFWFYALMPMVVHQATSYSYDVVIVSLILPLTALWLNYLTDHKYRLSSNIITILIVTIISIIKPVYLPLSFLFGIKNWTIKHKLKEFIIIGLIALLSVGIARIGKGDGNYPTFVNPKLQLQLIIHDPAYFTKVITTTWSDKFITHFDEMIGVFGWRNTPVNGNYFNYLFIILAFVLVNRLTSDLKNKLNISQILGILFVIFITTFLATLAMYLAWSPVGDKSVEGIQGRYWLPLAPIWLVFISGLVVYFKQNKIFRNVVIIFVLFCALLNIGFSLWSRYFDWSSVWVNKLDLKLSVTDLLVIDKPTTFIKSTLGKQVSGLAINLDNRGKSIILPYQYQVMDGRCQHIYSKGYLSPWDIQGDTQLILKFKPITVRDDSLCLKLSPATYATTVYQDRLNIKLTGNQPQIEWLYFP